MSVSISINGQQINFPESAASANWAPAIIQFAQAVQTALDISAGPADVPPQIYTMTSNANTNVTLPNLSFSTTTVRGAEIEYSVHRVTTSTGATEVAEKGVLAIEYNPSNPSGSKWEMVRDYVGDASVTFSITDVGQVQFSSSSISGSSHSGVITFLAKALLQSS